MLLIDYKKKRLYNFFCYFYLLFGVLELVFMAALSIVGEREFISIFLMFFKTSFFKAFHVISFYAFGVCALGFFLSNLICHSNSLHYLNPYVKKYQLISLIF